ncbi:MAG: hypothetical protein QJR12_12250 [Mycobacterium sp.]|uniref:hypothetical protein n=1 Tax=Mycobacterium sp. TaxID=1785 RepID=UPI00262332A3|nr:hypothetical protein [Mycobacterium sp.]MDI3314999.1 hypothetical protein [Mycobacterium sp.]
MRRTSPIGPAGATGRGIGLIRSVTVYSAEGRRSVIAARWLTTTGFADVSDLSGSHDARAALQVPGPVPAL